MSGKPGPDGWSQYIAAAADLRELVREAHGVIKDLRAAVREARAELEAATGDAVAARIQAEVDTQLAALRDQVGAAVTDATAKVVEEFDRFGEALLGKETYWARAAGRRSAPPPEVSVPAVGGER
jgi:Sec-independent protein translocase protein TatA